METAEILQRPTALDYTKESLKLCRNSKGFTWELKINGSGEFGLFTDADFERLKKREEQIFSEYGDKQ